MKVTINGAEETLTEPLSVSRLLVVREVANPEMVTVELNEQIIKRSDFETTQINAGDRVEFLYFMGGGNV